MSEKAQDATALADRQTARIAFLSAYCPGWDQDENTDFIQGLKAAFNAGYALRATSQTPDAVREALRKLAIVQRHLIAKGGGTVHIGYTCKVCDADWDRGQLEHHTPNCALSTPSASEAETWVTENPDGSISLDAYAGWSREQLKDRCSELCMAMEDWAFTAMSAATDGSNTIENVREPYRSKIAKRIEAYSDDEPTAVMTGDGSHPDDEPFDRFKNERDSISRSGPLKATVAAMDWAVGEIERLRSAPSASAGLQAEAASDLDIVKAAGLKTCLDETGLKITVELYKAVKDLKDASPCLLAMIGSWGDTLNDADILTGLHRQNEMGECFIPETPVHPQPQQADGRGAVIEDEK